MKILHAFVMCLSMFCALPVPCKAWDEDARGLMTAYRLTDGVYVPGRFYL